MTTRLRLRKQPHDLHLCSNLEELAAGLARMDIDPVSLVREFVKPSCPVGILAAGSIVHGVATEVSDLDILVLVPCRDGFKERRRKVAGSAVKYLPSDSPNFIQVCLFVGGMEVDLIFIVNPALEPSVDGALPPAPVTGPADISWLNRLATGWILGGHETVDQWRSYYGTGRLRFRWMAADYTNAAKTMEDMEAGIGRAPGHVATLGAAVVTSLLRALLAHDDRYCTSRKWMLLIARLIESSGPEMSELYREGRELAFPGLLSGVEEEREYFRRVHAYCARVRSVLCREEEISDILAMVTHDLDLIA